MDTWNKICCDSCESSHKTVRPGDRIICVNAVGYDASKMAQVIREFSVLKITIIHARMPQPSRWNPQP